MVRMSCEVTRKQAQRHIKRCIGPIEHIGFVIRIEALLCVRICPTTPWVRDTIKWGDEGLTLRIPLPESVVPTPSTKEGTLRDPAVSLRRLSLSD
jgi:hypothetical protein